MKKEKKKVLSGIDKLKKIIEILDYLSDTYMSKENRVEYYNKIKSMINDVSMFYKDSKTSNIDLINENGLLRDKVTQLKGKLNGLTSEYNRLNSALASKAMLGNKSNAEFLEGFIDEVKEKHSKCTNRYQKGLLKRFAITLTLKKHELENKK